MSSFEKETDRQYFFSRLKNPLWIQPLADRGCFACPPEISHLPGGYLQCPFWPELEFLKEICKDAPSDIVDAVIQIVLEIPPTDNPRVYEEMIDLVLQLSGANSTRLKPKVLEYAKLERRLVPSKLARILAQWTSKEQTNAALELADVLVQFAPDPNAQEKKRKYIEISKHLSARDEEYLTLMMTTKLEPVPPFNSIYLDVLNEGVRPLVKKEPYKVALILVNATDNMIRLGKHNDDLASGKSTDYLELWCPRLTKPRRECPDLRESLVHTLTYACESVWKRSSDLIGDLDIALRGQRWDVFKRIRQHLYGLHLSQHTRPFIRELILAHDDYSQLQYGYEFQQMVRLACKHFGSDLLTEEECTEIFDAILKGPPREFYLEWMGEHFTESEFAQQKRDFHHRQLRPFEPLLFGRYSDYFEELESSRSADEITDENYSRVSESEGGTVRSRSPKSPQELANLTDHKLLDYINRWNNEHRDKDDWLIEITMEALAGAFQSVFKDCIIPSDTRLNFWIGSRHNIHRPIYVRAMINAMQDIVKGKNHDKLDKWLPFCEWVISHPDPQDEHPYGTAQLWDRSSETPRWHTARRAVCDFIETCFERDSEVSISNRGQLGRLLGMLCTQYDWLLEQKVQTPPNGDDRLIETIDTTRGRALENLVRMGFWLRRRDDNAEITEMKAILNKRFDSESDCPLKPTEYAILGRLYQSIFDLDSRWAAASKSLVFPQHDFPAWLQAFAGFLRYSHPEKQIFDRVRDEYQFALDNMRRLELREPLEDGLKEILGQHLFKYYIWGVLPLEGAGSLLDGFFKATVSNRQHWAALFGYVGRRLKNTKKPLDTMIACRIHDYLEWRLQTGEPLELREFSNWLEADCLHPERRLSAYLRVLHVDDILHETDTPMYNSGDSAAIWLPHDTTQALRTMLPDYTPHVVRCFAKLTEVAPGSSVIYIPTNDARSILTAGLDHDDESVRENARQARENLLRRGYFSILD